MSYLNIFKILAKWLLVGGPVNQEENIEMKKDQSTKYKFNCWLCSGETMFDAIPSLNENKILEHPCKWCGMDNRVEIQKRSSTKIASRRSGA